ncbi:hypothetical protein N5079_04965 [Planotetraspora sp. A-T 1434]|nr:hypothetical protein [Planotetraspora sp. A-T 1434]MCT9929568.1 hypothetical protein [Planotetraspora sp. A-T 1434]
MPRIVRVDHGPQNGVWPNGEPQVVRDAYDAMLAEQSTTGTDATNTKR